jgi:Holliday junction resolvase RusA-like endonuclease
MPPSALQQRKRRSPLHGQPQEGLLAVPLGPEEDDSPGKRYYRGSSGPLFGRSGPDGALAAARVAFMAKLWLDEFWSSAVWLTEVVVPAKRVRYRVEPSGVVAEAWASNGVREFERLFREFFGGPKGDPRWPFRGRLLVAISVSLPEAEAETKDVDNIAKSILDACKGVVFQSDAQVHALFVEKKAVSAPPMVVIGFRLLPEGENAWYLPRFGTISFEKTTPDPNSGALDGAVTDEDRESEADG